MNIKEINSSKEYGFSCIYLWTNKTNNKKYVGQTINFYDRMHHYKNGYFNKYMKSAIQKYGYDGFDITILEKDVPKEKLDEREQYWLDYYKSYESDKGYNICSVASSTLGYHHTLATKELLSQQKKELFQSDPSFIKKFKEKIMECMAKSTLRSGVNNILNF